VNVNVLRMQIYILNAIRWREEGNREKGRRKEKAGGMEKLESAQRDMIPQIYRRNE